MRIYIASISLGILVAVGMVYIGMNRENVGTVSPINTAQILFGGDMMFDRSIRTTIDAKGGDYIFACLEKLLQSQDLVVANLEGPITGHDSISQFSEPGDGNNYTFTFAPETAQLLYKHNIRLVNIGNNHIMNFRLSGLNETKKYLTEAGVRYFGDPDSLEPGRVAHVEIHGVPFSFVNWSDWTSDNTDITAAQVRNEYESGRIVVVYAHWGEEYKPATNFEKRLAHNLIDEGAEIVIGSHPHVVQEHEVYKGKHIYYSLGNLIFDQYFEDAVMNGLLLEIQFSKDGVSEIKEIPVVLQKNRQTCPEPDIHRATVAER